MANDGRGRAGSPSDGAGEAHRTRLASRAGPTDTMCPLHIRPQPALVCHATAVAGSLDPSSVLLLVVRRVLAALERAPPRLVFLVPAHRLRQRLLERPGRTPAERVRLGAVERVAPVVAGPILHVAD